MTSTLNNLLVRMIRSIDMFYNLSDEECLELSNFFKLEYYPYWKTVLLEWKITDKMFILKNWLLEVKKANWHSTIQLWVIKAWEVFWEIWFIKNIPATATVIAGDDCDIWEISRKDFWVFLNKHSDILEQILSKLKFRENENKWKMSKWKNIENTDLDDFKIDL